MRPLGVSRSLALSQRAIAYTLRRSRRARRVRLDVHADGRVVMTVPTGFSLAAGERFLRERAEWLSEKLHFFERFPVRSARREDFLRYRAAARELVEDRLRYWTAFYSIGYRHITIRDQKTRWGSCSRNGNLSFNYRIVLLPAPLADYIIVHELCHRLEFNHGKRFWQLVTRALPDCATHRAALRNISPRALP
jgi:predicted metal-dependent hydrolase